MVPAARKNKGNFTTYTPGLHPRVKARTEQAADGIPQSHVTVPHQDAVSEHSTSNASLSAAGTTVHTTSHARKEQAQPTVQESPVRKKSQLQELLETYEHNSENIAKLRETAHF